jgi:hypothetical protein
VRGGGRQDKLLALDPGGFNGSFFKIDIIHIMDRPEGALNDSRLGVGSKHQHDTI